MKEFYMWWAQQGQKKSSLSEKGQKKKKKTNNNIPVRILSDRMNSDTPVSNPNSEGSVPSKLLEYGSNIPIVSSLAEIRSTLYQSIERAYYIVMIDGWESGGGIYIYIYIKTGVTHYHYSWFRKGL